MTDTPLSKASDFPAEVLALFDRYVHNLIDRRAFIEDAERFATDGLTAVDVLEALRPRFAQAQKVAPSDARIRAERVRIASPQGHGESGGYLVAPARLHETGPLPAVLVVHENRGLNPHIEDVARRLALENFVVLAPDALFPLGGYPGDEDRARELFAQLDRERTRQDFVAAAGVLKEHTASNGKVGVVGFCYGGGIANYLATRIADLRAAVPFYGSAPSLEHVPAVRARLLLHFAESDERINASWPAYEHALKAAEVKYEAFTYPATQHGFHNDTTPRYDPAAARLAWERTLRALHEALR